MRSRIGYALLCCSAMCCVAQLIVHLHLAWFVQLCLLHPRQYISLCISQKASCFGISGFLHHCEPHVRPWILDMRLATVCMSMYGPVYSICTQKPVPRRYAPTQRRIHPSPSGPAWAGEG